MKTNTQNKNLIETVKGDGSATKITDPLLAALQDEIRDINTNLAGDVAQRRWISHQTRLCQWDGQSPDGLKHEESIGAKPFPFEGSSDARVRLADQVITERIMVQMAAAMRSDVQVKGLNSSTADSLYGSRMRIVLQWILKNQLGSVWRRELLRLLNYVEGDSPGAGVLGIFWNRELGLRMETVKLEAVPRILMEGFGLDPQSVQTLLLTILDPTLEDAAIDALQQLLPAMRKKTISKIVTDLRETRSATFPVKYERENCVKVCALRLFEDIFIPSNTADLQKARCIFHREWITLADLEERVALGDYTQGFADEVKKHEGQTGFSEYDVVGVGGDGSILLDERTLDPTRNKGLYEIINGYQRAANDDGIPGIYRSTFSMLADVAAGERELLDYPHGDYPFVWFAREALASRLWATRGVAELLMTEQGTLKFMVDSLRDHVQISTLPPLKVPRRRPNLDLDIGPLVKVKEDRAGEVEFMKMAEYPAGNAREQEMLLQRVARQYGLPHENVPPDLTRLHWQDMADNFLAPLSDALVQMLQLAQMYLTDDQIQSITGGDGQPIARSRRDIEGKFNLTVNYQTGSLNMEWVAKMAEIISRYILPIDTVNIIQRDSLIRWLVSNVDYNLALEMIAPMGTANQKEIEDEQLNFAKIMAGIEPAMRAEGENFGLRAKVLQETIQRNPEIQQVLAQRPVSKAILEARLKHLEGQVQQQVNAQTGRNAAETVLG